MKSGFHDWAMRDDGAPDSEWVILRGEARSLVLHARALEAIADEAVEAVYNLIDQDEWGQSHLYTGLITRLASVKLGQAAA